MSQTVFSSSLHGPGKKSSATSNAENPTDLPVGRSKTNDPNLNNSFGKFFWISAIGIIFEFDYDIHVRKKFICIFTPFLFYF